MAGELEDEIVLKVGREAIYIGGFAIRFYGLLIALGVLGGVLLALSREKKLWLERDTTLDLALICVPAAIVGSRLYYVAFTWENYRTDLLSIFSIREGGMAGDGGVLAGILAGFLYSRAKKLSFWTLADLAAPSVALGQAVGRWGNFVNQEAFGALVSDPARQWFPLAVYIEGAGEWHLATFFYEFVWCAGIVLYLLLRERRGAFKRRGDMFLWYLLLYGLGRAWIEGLRTDSLFLGPVRVSQALAALLSLLAAAALLLRGRRKV